MVGGGHAGLVAEPFADVEGSLVMAGGFVVVPAALGKDAELVVAAGHAGLVAEPFEDVEGSLVLAGGFVVVAAAAGQGCQADGSRRLCGAIRRAAALGCRG